MEKHLTTQQDAAEATETNPPACGKPYRAPVLRSMEAFEKLALASCVGDDKFDCGLCVEC